LAQNVFPASLQIPRALRTHGKIFNVAFHHRAKSVPERNPPRSRHPAESLEETHAEHEDQPSRNMRTKSFSADGNVLHGELAKKSRRRLAELPENQRTAILLCRQGRISYEKIAEVLNCFAFRTKSLIHRGRGNAEGKTQTVSADRRVDGVTRFLV